MFPEALEGRWEEKNADAVQEEVQKLDREIDDMRGADFRDLVNAEKFTLSVPMRAEGDANDEAGQASEDGKTEEVTFRGFVDRTLKSELTRDLVKQGYIDRNFTLYAAQFYGDFTGVDVATFIVQIVQTVQTVSMDINYRFTSRGAFANLLAETDEDFTRAISAYNVQVVDYLLVEDPERADAVVNHLTTNFGAEAQRFLAAFFTSNGQRSGLAARPSHLPWQDVFTYLVGDEGVPTDVRTSLVDAALVAAQPDGTYDLGCEFNDFVVAHYNEMPAFTESHRKSELDAVVILLRRAEVFLPRLDGVHEELRNLIVDNSLYELTAENLRTALDISGEVTLDRARKNDTVFRYCLTALNAFLDAIEADDDTDYSVRTPQTLVDALEAAAAGDDETVERLAATASPEISLRRLTEAPGSTQPALAAAKLGRVRGPRRRGPQGRVQDPGRREPVQGQQEAAQALPHRAAAVVAIALSTCVQSQVPQCRPYGVWDGARFQVVRDLPPRRSLRLPSIRPSSTHRGRSMWWRLRWNDAMLKSVWSYIDSILHADDPWVFGQEVARSGFCRPSPAFADLREEARLGPSRGNVRRLGADTERQNRARGNPRTRP